MSTPTSSSTTPSKAKGETCKPCKMDASHVVVRLQQSKGLQDAFRVHILPESLTDAGLKLNDLCQITSEDGTTTGYGIAWRAEDKMGSRPKVRPAKMSETFRDLYDFKDGSKVRISRTDMKLNAADKVILYDVTPEGHNKLDAIDETDWESRISCLFGEPSSSLQYSGNADMSQRTLTLSPLVFHSRLLEPGSFDDDSISRLLSLSQRRPQIRIAYIARGRAL